MRGMVGRFSVEFPSGLVDPGETLEEAARRELAEETGSSGKIKVSLQICRSVSGERIS